MTTLTPDQVEAVSAWLATQTGGKVTIIETGQLSGGAIQENHRLLIDVSGGDWPGRHDLVLRRDAASAVATSHSRSQEFALLKTAHKAGVIVPIPCVLCEDPSILGGPFFLMHRVDGEARGNRLVKTAPGAALVRSLGENLARIHALRPPLDGLEFLGPAPVSPALTAVDTYRAYLDALPDAHPAIEWGLKWLEERAPVDREIVLCHRDYRTGNLMIRDGKLAATLDWEFAGWSDPIEDVGWFLAKCWRFGAWHAEAGGLGPRDAFIEAYETASGRRCGADDVAYWEVMAHVRWAVIALQQAHRHVSGEEQSLELALTAHVLPELEFEILAMTKDSIGGTT